jgi:dTDP-4-amino-4,6-dideoxy-D-galactose acyltransferase
LLTLGIKNANTNIGILAVNIDQRGKGVGRRLVERSFQETLNLGYKNIEVVTQLDNFKACNFYKKMGFVPKQIENVYHFWL